MMANQNDIIHRTKHDKDHESPPSARSGTYVGDTNRRHLHRKDDPSCHGNNANDQLQFFR